jgi:hypothetical protein
MLKLIVSAGLVLAAAMPAGAQSGTPDPETPEHVELVQSVSMDNLRQLLTDLDAKFIAAGRTGDGAPFVFGQFDEGLTFGAYAVCAMPDGSDCRGLELMAVYGSRADSEEIAGIDRDYPAISLYKSDGQKVRVSRYVILDHGVSWANLVENARVFHTLCGKVSERLAGLVEPEAPPEWE